MKRVKEIPDWFDLQKYNYLDGLDAIGWLYQLDIRSSMFYFLRGENQTGEDKDYFDDIWQQIKKSGAADFDAGDMLDLYLDRGCPNCAADQHTKWHSTVTVKPVDGFQIFIAYQMMIRNRNIGVSLNRYLAGEAEKTDIEAMEMPIDKLLQDCAPFLADIFCESDALINVDLNATNEQIMKDFEMWLSEYREYKGINYAAKKTFSQDDFHRWRNHKILPYIDLLIHQEKHGITFTEATLIQGLFPNETYGDGKIRKTVAPIANQLLSCPFQEALRVQVVGEYVDRKERGA
jgi:hypothetical protein